MKAAGDESESILPVQTDETFQHTVKSTDVIAADEALWSSFESFLGIDPVGAWLLVEVTHQPMQKTNEDGEPTGEWELVSSAVWRRDQDVPTPERTVEIAAELDEEEVE